MPKGFELHIDWNAIQAELGARPSGTKRAFVDSVAVVYGVSSASIYRQLKDRFKKEKSSPRSSEKYPKVLVHEAAKIQEEYKLSLIKGTARRLATRQIIELLEEQGIIEEGSWSVAGLNKALREVGYRNVQARVRVEADHYCQQFQIDFSRSKHFQVVGRIGDEDWKLRVSGNGLHYKDGEVKLRTWMVQMLDEYSRLRTVRYFPATGESPLLGIEFLDWYFNRGEDGHYLRHKPEAIRGDQGSFMKSAEAKSALTALGIEHRMSTPYNKETQGKVERGFGVLWSSFEARVAFDLGREQGKKAFITLSELNVRMNEFLILEQQKDHPFLSGSTRLAVAKKSAMIVRPAMVEADLRSIAFRTWEREADSTCMISIEGMNLEVPEKCAGKSVVVHRNLNGDYVGRLVNGYTAKPFAVIPYRTQALGSFDLSRSKAYSEKVRSEVVRDMKVRDLAPKAKIERPETVFSEVEKGDSVFGSQTMFLMQAKIELAKRLFDSGIYEDPQAYVPDVVMTCVETGALFNNMTATNLNDLVDRLTLTAKRQAM